MYRERPVMRTRMRPYVSRRRRRWDAVSWWFSFLFVIPAVLILGTMLWNVFTEGDSPSTMVLKITDMVTGQALAGAEVRAGDQIVTTNDQGEARIALPAQPMPIVVQHADYEPVHGEFDDNADPSQSLALRPSIVQGIVKDEQSGAAIAGATVSLLGSNGPTGEPATTGEDGSFRLRNVPVGAKLRVEAGDYGVIEQAIDGATQIDVVLRQTSITGRVVDADGNPLSGAVVASGETTAETAEDGSFKLTGVADGAAMTVSAAGYLEQNLTVDEQREIAVTLESDPDAAQDEAGDDGATASVDTPREIKAIYISAPTASTPAEMERLIQLIEDTELNAVVLDIKESNIFYDSQVEFFREAQIVQPLYDAEEILRQFHEHDIYVIARLVVFKDPLVAENRPDLAIKDETTGGVWRDFNGAAWVNPIHEELWDANIALAVEAAELGFDEIQYDYIRFPSDGDLSTADFGFDYTEEARVQTIVDFLKQSHEALQATGVPLAADVFGIIAIYPDDQGIGQRLTDIAPYVDYICPMIYPSHFDASSIDVGGEPNDRPYETIELSLALAAEKMPGMEGKLRPWLQDFFEYESEQVRAQIDATEESAASGWMIWDPSNQYSDGAFAADD